MRISKLLTIILVFSLPLRMNAQQCGNCNLTPSVAVYDLDVQVLPPKLQGTETTGWLEWLQLFWVNKHATDALFQNSGQCMNFTQPLDARLSDESYVSKDGIEIPPLGEESEILKVGATYTNLPPSGDVSRFGNYITTGYVIKSGDGYIMHLEIQTSCSRKTVASADVPFKASPYSENSINVGRQAAAQLSPLIDKIKQFELKERLENNRTAFEGEQAEAITIKPKKRKLSPGEQTEIEITLKDCDGFLLKNREVVFTKGMLNGTPISDGTTGGTVTPSTVITDANGKAKANFKMGKEKSAIIEAYHIYDKPYGCAGVKLGSFPIGLHQTPVKVEISYVQNETQTLKRATLPGVKVKGGDETEQTIMFHTTVMYHYPSASSMKDGFLVAGLKDDPNIESGKSDYVIESGYYNFTKTVTTAYITGMAGNVEMVQGTEKGSQTKIQGNTSLNHKSEIMFHKGTANEPASFHWNIMYPASSGDDYAYGSMTIVKGEKNVQWTVKKITDPESPYQTEYLIKLKLDAAEELKEGQKAMKELIGLDLDSMVGVIDPTNPQSNMAGARGSKSITVRILSPYPAN
jgi:hypothetical protein